jgi:DNA-binding SARP family transcriptional activator
VVGVCLARAEVPVRAQSGLRVGPEHCEVGHGGQGQRGHARGRRGPHRVGDRRRTQRRHHRMPGRKAGQEAPAGVPVQVDPRPAVCSHTTRPYPPHVLIPSLDQRPGTGHTVPVEVPPGSGRIGILGPVELVGGEPVPLGGVKERCLLAALAVHCGEAVSTACLADALWGDDPPRTAAKTLQNYVLRVRRALARAGGLAIVTLGDGYCLRAWPGGVDAALAESLIGVGRREMAGGDPAAAARLLRRALGLWRGPALGEFADRPFAAAEALRLEELHEAALEDLFDAELALGRHHEVVSGLEALVASGRLRERRWGQLMVALYRDGRQAEALDAFGRLRQILQQDLGVDPGAELRRLQQAILQQSPELTWRPQRGTRREPRLGYFGRDREMSRLQAHFDEAAAGRGGVVLLAGEPGIGKSHALRRLADAAQASSAVVLAGRCAEGVWAPPFRPFAEMITGYADLVGPRQLSADLGPGGFALARIVPRLGELLPDLAAAPALQPDEERFRLLDAAAQFFLAVSGHATVLLMLDDLQWADAGTAMMIRHVARSCGNRPLLVAGGYRTTEVASQDRLADLLGALQAETRCSVIRLQALGREAIGQLAAAEAGAPVSPSLATAVAAHTGGNPFFAKEVIRHLLEERALAEDGSGALEASLPLVAVPEGVRQVIARRCARLPHRANRLAEAASGFAGPFLFPVAAVAAGLGDQAALTALDELLAAGLIRPGVVSERYEFMHALVRQAIYDTLSPSRQARLHRQLARSLEMARARAPGCAEPAEIVAQYAGSRALPGADAGVAAAMEAADLAQAAGAHETAVAFLTSATDLAGPGDERLGIIRARLGLALAWALRFDEAVTAAGAAAEQIAQGAGPHAAAGYLAEVTSALSAAGSSAHAWKLAPAGLAYAGSARDEAWAALTLLTLDRKEAIDPDYVGLPTDQPRRRRALAILYQSPRAISRSVDLARYAVAAIYGRRDSVPAEAAQDPTVLLYLLGGLRPAVPLFEEAAAQARARGELAREVHCRASIARALAALGDLEGARAALAQARDLANRIPDRNWSWERIHVEGALDALTMATGEDWASTQAVFEELVSTQDPVPRWARAPMSAGCARTAAHLGRAERAMALLALPVRALARAPAWALNYTRTACDTAETLWLLGRRDHLQPVEAAVRLKALPADFRFPAMDLRLSLARLCAVDGRLDEAAHWFAQAREVLEEQEARPLRAITDFDEALMYARLERHASARPLLEAAVGQFQRIGMTGWLRRAERVAAMVS